MSFHLFFFITPALTLAESYRCIHDLEAWCSVSSCCLHMLCGPGAHLCLDLQVLAEAALDWVLFSSLQSLGVGVLVSSVASVPQECLVLSLQLVGGVSTGGRSRGHDGGRGREGLCLAAAS